MKKILFISAVWCPACLIMRPRYQVAIKHRQDIEFVEIDFDDDKPLFASYMIGTTLPVAIIFEGTLELGRIIGELPMKELQERLGRL